METQSTIQPSTTMQTTQNDGKTQYEIEYINTFTEKEKHAYSIAKDHLGMTFQIEKSIGYRDWLKTKQKPN